MVSDLAPSDIKFKRAHLAYCALSHLLPLCGADLLLVLCVRREIVVLLLDINNKSRGCRL